jgi:hypothetical protein
VRALNSYHPKDLHAFVEICTHDEIFKNISTLNAYAFESCQDLFLKFNELHSIYLTSPSLITLDLQPLAHLKDLKQILLDGIKPLHLDAVSKDVALEYIQIKRASLVSLEDLYDYTHLTRLNLSDNLIDSASFFNFTKHSKSGSQLKHLILDRNQIDSLSGIEHLIRLETLSLSANTLQQLCCLKKNTSLLVLNVSHNPLTIWHKDTFSLNPSFDLLSFAYIHHIDETSLATLKTKYLDIQGIYTENQHLPQVMHTVWMTHSKYETHTDQITHIEQDYPVMWR